MFCNFSWLRSFWSYKSKASPLLEGDKPSMASETDSSRNLQYVRHLKGFKRADDRFAFSRDISRTIKVETAFVSPWWRTARHKDYRSREAKRQRLGQHSFSPAAPFQNPKPFRLPNQAFQKSRFFHAVETCNNLAFSGATKTKVLFGLYVTKPDFTN